MSDEQHPSLTPLQLVVHDLQNDEALLCCPVCGGDYVHLSQVAVEQGQTRTTVGNEATHTAACDRGLLQRGSLLVTSFWCEQGHAFEYRYSFCKGHVLCELVTGLIDTADPHEELWRN